MKTSFVIGAVMLFLPPASAHAQDFLTEWLDRAGRELEQARPPLATKAAENKMWVGALAYYDTNINLESDRENASTVLAGFGRARIEYADPRLDAVLDLQAVWKQYVPQGEASDDEERVFARVRYIEPRWSFEAAEIFRHETEATDAVFADRIDRIVSNTYGRATFEIGKVFALETTANAGVVRAMEKEFDDLDNINLRGDTGFVVHASESLDFLAHAGVLAIDYRYATGAAEDVSGYYARGGLRGDLVQKLSLTAIAGWTKAKSDDPPGGDGEEASTGDVSVHLRWEVTEKAVAYADYSRQIAFNGYGADPFQIVNRWVASLEIELTSYLAVRARAQFDHVDTSRGLERDFLSAGITGSYRSGPKMNLEGGVIWRTGEADLPGDPEFDDIIVHLGIVTTN